MSRTIKHLAVTFVVVLIVLIGILIFNASRGAEAGPMVEPVTDIPVDEIQAAQRLAGAIRFETVSHEDRSRLDAEAFLALHAYLEESFPLAHTNLEQEVVAGYSLLYRWPGQNSDLQPILLMGHLDVVPIEEESRDKWSFPPFSGEIVDGYVLGRGTMDDKSGAVGLFEAVELLLERGWSPARTVYLAFGHDEEVGGWDGAKEIAELLESRGVRLAFVLDEGGMITQGIITGIEKPLALVGVSEKGYVNIELSTEVEGGHSSVPQRSTAIGILSRAISKIEDRPPPPRLEGPARDLIVRMSPELAWPLRLVTSNLWLFEPVVAKVMGGGVTGATLRTLITPTVIQAGVKANVLPTQARALLNVRTIPGDTAQSVRDYLTEVVDDERVTIEIIPPFADPPPASDLDTPAYALIERSIREVATEEELIVAPFVMVGGTDSKHYVSIADQVYRFLGMKVAAEDIARYHGIDEKLSVANHARVIRTWYQVLRNSDQI